ncbi:SulP family inorganic anion transporter [Akkermansiaceae bacterium]|nr:SulP family inorganic anion transporter [Akkermansiaceae bacterium]
MIGGEVSSSQLDFLEKVITEFQQSCFRDSNSLKLSNTDKFLANLTGEDYAHGAALVRQVSQTSSNAMIFNLIKKQNGNWKDDTLSGLTVALALVPEAIAFSFIAGVDPLVGLWAAVFMGFITSSFGGRPGMISGSTGAIAIVVAAVVRIGNIHGKEAGIDDLGIQYLFATLMIAGLIQIAFGIGKLGRFIRLVPHPVMMGFVNGLAIVILLGQFGFFKTPLMEDGVAVLENGEKVMTWMATNQLVTMGVLAAITMAIIQFLPKLTNAVPSILVAILAVGLACYFGLFDTKTIADYLRENGGDGTLSGNFPLPVWPSDIDWGKDGVLLLIVGTAFSTAMVGIIESLMTLQLIDDMTETRGSGNRECLAQGSANFLSGLFGGMGGCAMIGQSLINIKSGGRGRWSGIVAALVLMLFILVGGPVIVQIPIAALVGVMFMVVIGTFEWSTLQTFGRVQWSEIIVILAVTLITVFMHNLALAVLVGVILSTLVFAWESAKHVRLRRDDSEEGVRIYNLQGVLYFGSVREFAERLVPADDPEEVIIDFAEARVADFSSLEALNGVTERYKNAGKRIRLRHLSPACVKMIDQADAFVTVEVAEDDPHYEPANI